MRSLVVAVITVMTIGTAASPALADDALGGGLPEAAVYSNPHVIGTLPIPIPQPNEGVLYYNPNLAGGLSLLPLPPPNEGILFYNPHLSGVLPTPLP